jgi:uncharacterized protein YggE
VKQRIDVEGSARRSVPADRVLWSLAVVESGDVPAEAFARGGERLDALTRRLRDELGDDADVRTGALSVRPQRDEHGRTRAQAQGTGLCARACTAPRNEPTSPLSRGRDRR